MADERATELGFTLPETSGDDADVLDSLLSTEDDPDSQREELSNEELGSLQDEFDRVARLDRKRKAMEDALSDMKRDLQAAKDRMLQVMKQQGTSQFKSGDGLGSCYVQERFDTTVDDPDAFLGWVRQECPELLTVHSQTRNSFIRREFRDKGVDPESDEFPPGIKVTPREQLAIRGAKPRK